MLSKKILFNKVTQKVLSSVTSTHFIRTTVAPAYYLSKRNFSKAEEKAAANANNGNGANLDEPKWMRFFRGMEPNPIDLERAVKCDNVEMLNNYVKMNYIGFNFNQLVTVLGSLTKIWITSSRIFTEIKLRIVGDKYESNKKIMYLLFSGGKDLILRDVMMKKFISLELDKYFDEYTHSEQAEIVQFMFDADVVKTSRVIQYLSFYKNLVESNTISEYFDGLSFQEMINELKVFQSLSKNLTDESFNQHVDKKVLTIFTNKILDLLGNPKNLQEKSFYYDFEPQLPEAVPTFFTPEQETRYKNQLAHNIFLRYNIEQNLGIYMINKREKNVYRLLKETFTPGDRYLVEVPCYAVSQQICQKNVEGERFDLILLSYLSKFGIVDLNYLDGALETLRVTLKTISKKGRLERPLIVFLLTRWRQLTELNFDESFKSVDSSEKQVVSFLKSEMAKLFERFINETNSSNDVMLSKLCEIITKAPTKAQEEKIKMSSDDETNEISAKVLDIEGESLLEALREEIGGEDKEILKPVLGTEAVETQMEEGKVKDKYKHLLDMIPGIIKNYEDQLQKNEFVQLSYFDKILSDSDTEIISDYVNVIDVIPRFFLYDAMTDSLASELKKYFLRKDHELILESFLYFPNLLESLVLLDQLAKDYYHKVGRNDSIFPDKLRVRIYQEKRKIDDLFAQYQGKRSELLKVISGRFGEKAKTTKEVKLNTRNHYDTLLNISKLELVVNKNKDKYQKDIEWTKGQEQVIKYKYTNARDITEVYSESEDNLYIKCLNTSAFNRSVNNSYLKRIVARTLKKMGIQFKQDYSEFPFVADFLLVLAEDQKIILQVIDPEKQLLGVDNVRTINAKIDEFGFSRHGYTIINFRAQDYDLDEEAMMEKIRAAIKANT